MKRCMVIDDSRVIRRVAAKIVQDLGFASAEAADGHEALAACEAAMPTPPAAAALDSDALAAEGRG